MTTDARARRVGRDAGPAAPPGSPRPGARRGGGARLSLRREDLPARAPHHGQPRGRPGGEPGRPLDHRPEDRARSRASPRWAAGSTASPPTPPTRSSAAGAARTRSPGKRSCPRSTATAISSSPAATGPSRPRIPRSRPRRGSGSREAIDSLPADYRTAFVLHDMEGLSNPEIAEMLGISLPGRQVARPPLAPVPAPASRAVLRARLTRGRPALRVAGGPAEAPKAGRARSAGRATPCAASTAESERPGDERPEPAAPRGRPPRP